MILSHVQEVIQSASHELHKLARELISLHCATFASKIMASLPTQNPVSHERPGTVPCLSRADRLLGLCVAVTAPTEGTCCDLPARSHQLFLLSHCPICITTLSFGENKDRHNWMQSVCLLSRVSIASRFSLESGRFFSNVWNDTHVLMDRT